MLRLLRPDARWACAFLCLFGTQAQGAQLLVSGSLAERSFLDRHVVSWESSRGHQVAWIAAEQGEEGPSADLVVAGVAEILNLHAAGALQPVEPSNAWPEGPPPLLARLLTLDDGQRWLALPLARKLPALQLSRARMAAAGVEPPRAASWREVFDIAARMSDPVGNVHGLCLAGHSHATVVRSLLADEGSPWLDQTGRPYTGEAWLDASRRYATALARSGPPNAATLTAHEMATLLAWDKCAVWIGPVGERQRVPPAVAVPLPGAASFVSAGLTAIAVAADSEKAAIAADLAWWVAQRSLAEAGDALDALDPGAGSVAAVTLDQNGPAEMYRAPGSATAIDWQEVDRAGEQPLQQLIDGLVPAAAALEQAAAGLP